MIGQLAREVRDFWLDPGRLDRSAQSNAQIVRERFTSLLDQAAAGALSSWTHSPRRALSLIIVLDQFSRIIYQGTARCYACDERALATTLNGIQSGADATLTLIERLYFCMPLQRAESLATQEESLAIFERLASAARGADTALASSAVRTARDSHSIIVRFGRFPRRNRVLGRTTTPAEHAWLACGTSLPVTPL
ncbi:MAG TPA: DUF924 family protein [Steroidobacteraceae bacterium]|jgi:uncharacterized protein (DUF924 family)|nr:DUF924 family protein [Steroidobacteraceae bacterium]